MTTEEQFFAAVNVVNNLPKNGPFQPSPELVLKFYSYHKQVMDGPCNIPKPPFWDVNSRSKWTAWKNLGDMSKETAMKKYVDELVKIVETMSYNENISNFMDVMGPLYEIVWLDEDGSEQLNTDSIQSALDNTKDAPFNLDTAECFKDKSIEENHLTTRVSGSHTSYSCSHGSDMSTENVYQKNSITVASTTTSLSNMQHSKLLLTENLGCSDSAKKESMAVNNNLNFSDHFAFKNKSRLHVNQMLSFSVRHLQKSLDDVVSHLDALEVLIKNYKPEHQKVMYPISKSSKKGLSVWTFTLVFIWPFAVHWLIYVVQLLRKRRLRIN